MFETLAVFAAGAAFGYLCPKVVSAVYNFFKNFKLPF